MTNVTVNNFIVTITKNGWLHEHLDVAICLGFKIVDERTVVVDIAMTAKNSLNDFFKSCVPEFYNGNRTYRDHVFAQIRNCYEMKIRRYMSVYYPKLKYERNLYWHQRDAHATMLMRQFNLLSFDMGLGKTITAASMSKMLGISRTIIICPSLVKWNWLRDLCDAWGYNSMYFTILDAKSSNTKKAFIERFVVVNYEMIEKHWDSIVSGDCGHIIIDECHYMKNHKTRRYKNVERLVKHYPNTRVTMLSGTPITNRVNDIFAYLKLSNHHLGLNHKAFMDRYTVSKSTRGQEKVSGSINIDELKIKISNFMIRRKSEECLDLPDLIIKNYYLENDVDDEETDTILKEMSDQADQYENAVGQEKRNIKFAMTQNIHSLNRITATSKVKSMIEIADQIHEAGRKLIVFSSYTAPLDALVEHYKHRCVKIDGSVPSHTRDELIERFKKKDEVFLFCGNVKAAGVGINLVNANDVFFLNLPFTPDDLEQPYKRAHRIGQKKTVNVGMLIAQGSIDEYIYEIIRDKSGDINFVVDGEGKKGVVDYNSIPNELFSGLVNNYRKKRGLPQLINNNKLERV